MEDLSFLDSLQKLHTKQVGWMPTKQLEGKIKLGHVLVAEQRSEVRDQRSEVRDQRSETPKLTSDLCPLTSVPVGYCIANDQYFKRDDVGIIYQLNVAPTRQRALIGAMLLKAQFDRSAYGCKLYCCWCAQDIAANRFWEAMGFVPLAYRAGSETKSRVHIFWQKRIRAGDVGEKATPWWFPSKTSAGSIREDRIVLPIPLGTHWSDAKPLILPAEPEESRQLPAPKRAAAKKSRAAEKPLPIRRNGLRFDIPQQGEPLPEAKPSKAAKEKAIRVKRPCDPRLLAAARELKDRWLEQVNADPSVLEPAGKYDVARALPERQSSAARITPLPLPAAA
jgi:hypothetical protein